MKAMELSLRKLFISSCICDGRDEISDFHATIKLYAYEKYIDDKIKRNHYSMCVAFDVRAQLGEREGDMGTRDYGWLMRLNLA